MSVLILILTIFVLVIPVIFTFIGFYRSEPIILFVAALIWLMVLWTWFWMRPSYYIVHNTGLMIVWPLRKLYVLGNDISSVRVLDRKGIKKELGLAMRIGVGGLFGGFGLLWTRRRGMMRFYITRLDYFVLIEQKSDKDLLLSVDYPEKMKEMLTV